MSELYNNICYLSRRWLKVTKFEPIPTDVQELFGKYAGGNKRMTAEKFVEFLVKDGALDKDTALKTAKDIIRKTHGTFKPFRKKDLTDRRFLSSLLKKANHPLTSQVENDTKAPLAHYFWYTGHASYLYMKYLKVMENHPVEFSLGTIIIKSIKKALKEGVRVIELDLDPNEHHTDFRVRHAGIPDVLVSLEECLTAINHSAFSYSGLPAPLILILVDNFDSNARTKLEPKLIKIVTQTFGNKIHSPTKTDNLESLKDKIIITIRRSNQLLLKEETPEEIAEPYNKILSVPKEEMDNKFEALSATDPKKIKFLSLTEGHLENSSRTQGDKNVRFTQENMLAVYLSPQGTETFSRNSDPLIGWIHGAQLVSSYMQIHPNIINNLDKKGYEKYLTKYLEKYSWIQQGLFRAYGMCGCVKKPHILLNETKIFNPREWRPVKKILKVKVYFGTGWHLDFDSKEFDQASPPDFFAAIAIVGVPEDEATERTLPAMDQWIPEWNQEFEFPLTVPELAFLVIKVSEFDADRTHDFGGQTCLPVSKLRNGIRAVPLCDKGGKPYRAVKLLMRFQLV